MIIVKLKGGLGNQMFQYAFGRRIAIESNSVLKLDITSFKYDKVYGRKYSLDCFNISENIATENELLKSKILTGDSYFSKFLRLSTKLIPYTRRYIINERASFQYDSRLLLRKYQNVYFDGYWQNEKYFKSIEAVIRKEFMLKDVLKNDILNRVPIIQNTNSVAIHIRYYNVVKAKDIEMIPLDYYYKSIKYLTGKLENMHLFVFSDNLEWAKNNLIFPYPTTFVNNNENKHDYEDMILMSLCKHQIIANSTFSWWAAWLNTNPKKAVLCPKEWFRNDPRDTSDLIPKSWVRI